MPIACGDRGDKCAVAKVIESVAFPAEIDRTDYTALAALRTEGLMIRINSGIDYCDCRRSGIEFRRFGRAHKTGACCILQMTRNCDLAVFGNQHHVWISFERRQMRGRYSGCDGVHSIDNVVYLRSGVSNPICDER